MGTKNAVALFLAVWGFLFTSCLSSHSSLDLSGSTIKLNYHYEIHPDLLNFARYGDEPTQMSLPIEETAFWHLDNLNPEIRLKSYRNHSDRESGNEIIDVKLELDSISAISKIYPQEEALFEGDSSKARITFPLVEGIASSVSAQQRELLLEDDNLLVFYFSFIVPSENASYSFSGYEPPMQQERIQKSGKRIDVEFTGDDLLEFDGMAYLEMRW